VNAFVALILTLVGVVGLLVVLTHDPVRQTVLVGVLSLLLAVLFLALQAPDVALSELAIGTVAVPLMILLAIGKIREHRAREPGPRE
jgi:energy-converting hydrogenase B subunit D